MPAHHLSLPKPRLGRSRTLPTLVPFCRSHCDQGSPLCCCRWWREGTQLNWAVWGHTQHSAVLGVGPNLAPSRRGSFSLAPLAVVLYVFDSINFIHQLSQCLNTMVAQSQFNWTFSLDSLENNFHAYVHFCSGESSAGRASDQDKVGPDFQWVSILENSQESKSIKAVTFNLYL